MTTYICKDELPFSMYSMYLDELCECEYREIEPGIWEFRYQGPGYGQTNWIRIAETSLEEIRSLGHTNIEVVK